jgi:hypothetical protein
VASIVRQNVGGNTYLYESVSYRNEEGKPRNRRIPIGKIDKKSGRPIYKPEYIRRMAEAGTPVESVESTPEFSVEYLRRSTMLNTGLVHLLGGIADQIGLSAVLRQVFPHDHEQIFALATFLFASGDPVSYCAEWMERSDVGELTPIASQRISEILMRITDRERQLFFAEWNTWRSDQEYLALDITSVSSWSQLIDDVEWGYNRDGDSLAQINLCMLMGEQSRLPVRMTVYNGSIRDVSTLRTTIDQTVPKGSDQPVMIVMDKGFASKKNVDMLLATPQVRFLVALPLTMSFTKRQIDAERKDIDRFATTIVTGSETLHGITKERSWMGGRRVSVHVYYNEVKATATRNRLYGRVQQLVEAAENDPEDGKLQDQFKRYLIIRKSSNDPRGHTITVREDVIADELAYAGWLVLVGNQIENAAEAIRIYRDKDVVEKGFLRLKHSLGLDRLRVHSQEAMESKVFVGFLALILSAHVHRIMSDHNLYRSMTIKDLIRTMEKLRTQIVDGRRILFPLTKRQKQICAAFGISPPA